MTPSSPRAAASQAENAGSIPVARSKQESPPNLRFSLGISISLFAALDHQMPPFATSLCPICARLESLNLTLRIMLAACDKRSPGSTGGHTITPPSRRGAASCPCFIPRTSAAITGTDNDNVFQLLQPVSPGRDRRISHSMRGLNQTRVSADCERSSASQH